MRGTPHVVAELPESVLRVSGREGEGGRGSGWRGGREGEARGGEAARREVRVSCAWRAVWLESLGLLLSTCAGAVMGSDSVVIAHRLHMCRGASRAV